MACKKREWMVKKIVEGEQVVELWLNISVKDSTGTCCPAKYELQTDLK